MAAAWTRRHFITSTIVQGGAISVEAGSLGTTAARPAPLIAFRVGTNLWMTDQRLQELLDFFDTQRGAVDELAFFTSGTHPPLPVEEMALRAERLAKVLPRVREHGIGAGINVLSTMGHHEENLPHSLRTAWQRVRDPQGRECLGSFCPAHPELIDYARKIYTLMAQAGPDFLWVDDDVRLQGHKPVDFACFCDLCVQRFSVETGRRFTRDTLIAAFGAGSLDERLRLRRQWLEHNRKVIDDLLRNIEEAVHAVKPGLPLGFMTGDRFYEGYDFERWAATLAGPHKAPVRWRPGGGFYSDESLLGLVDKANTIGRQTAAVPAEVAIIQSELENFPYQRLRKSAQTTVVEASAHMAAGTTGTAFNVLTMQPDSLDEYVPLFRKICQYRPFHAQLAAELGRSLALGIWPAWNHDLFSTVNIDGAWLAGGRMSLSEPYVLGEIGIPLCYDARGATATALSGTSVLAFSRDRLRRMFSDAVLMDVAAWQSLQRLGLERWTGVRAVDAVDRDAMEVLARHPLNGRFSGWPRDCRQSFWWERGWDLTPAGGSTEILARMVDYGNQDLGPSMTAFTNELGGRVVIMGYFPWSQMHSLAKSSQMKSICDWLSRGRLPVVTESFSKVVIWCRQAADGRNSLLILNASLDPVDSLTLRVRTEAVEFTHFRPSEKPQRITAAPIASPTGRVRLVVTDLEPWSIHLVTNRAG